MVPNRETIMKVKLASVGAEHGRLESMSQPGCEELVAWPSWSFFRGCFFALKLQPRVLIAPPAWGSGRMDGCSFPLVGSTEEKKKADVGTLINPLLA